MAKFIEFEVLTPVALDNSSAFFGAIDAASKPFDAKSNQLYRSWGTGEMVEGHDTSLRVIDSSKLHYIHTSRIVDPVRDKEPGDPDALDFFQVARKLDPKLKSIQDSEAVDLQKLLADELYQAIGRRTLVGISMPFNCIDVIESNKTPSETVFVLRQEPLLMEPEQSERTFHGCIPFETASEFILDMVRDASQVVYDMKKMNRGTTGKTIEDSLPFASTKESNPEIISEFVETLTYNLFDPSVIIRPTDNIQITYK